MNHRLTYLCGGLLFGRLGGLKCCSHLCLLSGAPGRPYCFLAVRLDDPVRCNFSVRPTFLYFQPAY